MTIRYNGPGDKTRTFTTRTFTQGSKTGSDYFREPLHLSKGDRIDGRFLVQEPISLEGGQGDIYHCVDVLTNESVAVKFYHGGFKPKEPIVDELLNLNHPNLVRVITYGVWNNRFYEAMEYCAGGVLTNFFPLNVAQLRALLPGIINGLKYLHDRNIIHRDIKPDNFYFRQEKMKDLVIGDFGISSLAANDKDNHKTHTQGWSIDYTAPELFRDSIYKASDYYSLGITLMHAFFGKSPLATISTAEARMHVHVTGSIPKLDELPEELRVLVKGLIQINPENRWTFSQVNQWLQEECV